MSFENYDDECEFYYNPYTREVFNRRTGCPMNQWDMVDQDLQRHDPPHTTSSHPYSYDPFTIWGGPSKECNASDWTDRFDEWDYKKAEQLRSEIYWVENDAGEKVPQRPYDRHRCRGDLIETFLQKYLDDATIRLLRVVEFCNASSGYPTWRLDYKTTKLADEKREEALKKLSADERRVLGIE